MDTADKFDLFETLVRFLAVKPAPAEDFDLERAKDLIKKDKVDSIVFSTEHSQFEQTMELLSERVGKADLGLGILFIDVLGPATRHHLLNILPNILVNVRELVIYGKKEDWVPLRDQKIKFEDAASFIEENHQRFFLFHSNSFNIALVSRKAPDGTFEGAITNDPQAVAQLSQLLGTKTLRTHKPPIA